MKALLGLLVIVVGCSGNTEAESNWHCFDFEGSDFGCVCEEGEPAYEPTGDTCAPTGCCFEYVALNDVGEGTNACRCVPEDARDCAGIVAPYEGNIVASCPG